jgi:hypothetical protein
MVRTEKRPRRRDGMSEPLEYLQNISVSLSLSLSLSELGRQAL